MKHYNTCDQCETVAHCSNHGCIPLQPAQQKPLTPERVAQLAHLHGHYQTRFKSWLFSPQGVVSFAQAANNVKD